MKNSKERILNMKMEREQWYGNLGVATATTYLTVTHLVKSNQETWLN